MLRISQLLDARRRDSGSDTATSPPDSPTTQTSQPPPQSPTSINSSAPVSPAVSLFSAKGHTRVSSSVSSLVSASGLGISFDSPSKGPLTDVKEEEPTVDPCESELNEEYLGMFNFFFFLLTPCLLIFLLRICRSIQYHLRFARWI